MDRGSPRSSTTTSSAVGVVSARIRAADWPLTAIVIAIGAAVAFDNGGYFPTAWGWSSAALFWVAASALFLRRRLSFGRPEVPIVAALAGFVGWAALSSTWSTSVERSIAEAQRGLVYVGGLLVVFVVARGRSIAELLVAVFGVAIAV